MLQLAKKQRERYLLNKGIGSYIITINKLLLILKDRLKRLKWCRERINRSVEECSRVILSDEANFEESMSIATKIF